MSGFKGHIAIILSALTLFTFSPALAQAQDNDGGFVLPNVLSSSTSYASGTTTGLGTTAVVIWLLTSSSSTAHLELYLRQNRPQVEQALMLGAGQASQDLAHFFGVSADNYPAFATMLRQRRQALLATIAPEATRADLFIAHITQNMRAHHTLRHDVLINAQP